MPVAADRIFPGEISTITLFQGGQGSQLKDYSAIIDKRVLELPKVDLHRHLEGSIRLETMVEVVREASLPLPEDIESLRRLVQVVDGDPKEPALFLSKFTNIRLFFHSPEIIQRITVEAVEDAARDQVRYLELRFTPAALAQSGVFDMEDVTRWVIDAAAEAASAHGIEVGLIVSVNRHESLEIAEEAARIAVDHIHNGIVGLDLAGDEVEFPAQPFQSILASAKQAGLGLTIHAGEWTGAENVRHAILELGADRIGHGIRILDDPQVVSLARARGIPFEVSIDSNYLTGGIPSLSAHPLPQMIQAGLQTVLTTDDPSIFGTTLSLEYQHAVDHLGLSLESLKGFVLTAVQAAFLDPLRISQLESEFVSLLWRS
ncbi:MAG: adenosine deaminase [Anaerolineales bacterium]|nr:MAG: adenosine deaminase [Anaerolineales bacterium]